jgi:hypothetical protein
MDCQYIWTFCKHCVQNVKCVNRCVTLQFRPCSYSVCMYLEIIGTNIGWVISVPYEWNQLSPVGNSQPRNLQPVSNPGGLHCVHLSSPQDPLLNQLNPAYASIPFFSRICFNIVFPYFDITVNTAYLHILEPLDHYYQHFYSIPAFHHSWEEMNVCQEGVREHCEETSLINVMHVTKISSQESIWTPIITSTREISWWIVKFEIKDIYIYI